MIGRTGSISGDDWMIAVIDYGMGNLGSILNTFRRIGVAAKISSNPEEIQNAQKLILPGVGSFKKGIENLKASGLIQVLEEEVVVKKKPILGICLGMQLFSRTSEEGGVNGLGWIDAETVRFRLGPNGNRLKIPHMGWNAVQPSHDPVLAGISLDDRFYFVHSYHLTGVEETSVIGTTTYGYAFPSVVRQDNIIGIQCHPERSHSSGIRIMKNFVSLR